MQTNIVYGVDDDGPGIKIGKLDLDKCFKSNDEDESVETSGIKEDDVMLFEWTNYLNNNRS